MSKTTFSGPVQSNNGFIGSLLALSATDPILQATATVTGGLPAPTAAIAGQVRLISDNGAGNNEWCLVICTGAAWVTATGQALT